MRDCIDSEWGDSLQRNSRIVVTEVLLYMKMRSSIKIQNTVRWILITSSILALITGCSRMETRSPEDWFNFCWAGLAGSDGLAFHGSAVLLRGEELIAEGNVSYSGQLRDHHELAMKSLLPGTRINKVNEAGNEIKLRWKDGSWSLKSNENDTTAQAAGLARMNPLDQLEEIKNARKNIKLENASARGTKVLRIEIDPADAKEQLQNKLVMEMENLRNKWQRNISKLQSDRRSQVSKDVEAHWSTGKEQLIRMLDQADAKVTYHLTIDRNSGLPIRLTSETRLDYPNIRGINEHEVLLSDNRFVDYQ
ncbi:hypothetical protein D3C78_615870 [compost metagenome]